MDDDYLKTKNYKNQYMILNWINKGLNGSKEMFVNQSWGPLVILARMTIISLMEKIQHGQLRVLTQSGIYTFGQPHINQPEIISMIGYPEEMINESSQSLKAEIRVINDSFWVRMFLLSDLGFAESYMVGDIVVDDLDSLFKMFIINRSNLSEMSMTTSSIYSTLNTLMNSRFINSISNTISNISAHYDISNDMFEAFLSKDMTYSCGYFTEELGGINGDLINEDQRTKKKMIDIDELEESQYSKLDLIIKKANIKPNQRVLEIGTGWGSLAIRIKQKIDCEIDTITLSIEQKTKTETLIKNLGYEKSIRVHLIDYREIPRDFYGKFDRLISIEMIESVGLEFLDTYFDIVDRCLKPNVGIGVFQVITIPDSRFEKYRYEVDFIRKWIFPGGVLPSISYMVNSISKGSKNKLIIESIQNIGPHYARTLREWQQRFEMNFYNIISPSLKRTYPNLKNDDRSIEIFKRKWIYYFSYCATGFSTRVLGDHIFTLTREGNMSIS